MALTIDPNVLSKLTTEQRAALSSEQQHALRVAAWRSGSPRVHSERFTAPVDPRFATTQDKSKYCWSLFNEFLRCVKVKGNADAPQCQRLLSWSHSVCPTEWTKQWEEQREAGIFPGIKVKWTPPAAEEEAPVSEDPAADVVPAEETLPAEEQVKAPAITAAKKEKVAKKASKKKEKKGKKVAKKASKKASKKKAAKKEKVEKEA